MSKRKNPPREFICDECCKAFISKPSEKQGEHHFCTQKCYTEWRKGRKREGYVPISHTQEFKDIMSERMKGNQHRKGKKHTKESKKKMSIAIKKGLRKPEVQKILSDRFSGEKNPNWHGGQASIQFKESHELSSKQWQSVASEIRERDNYTCQFCGAGDSSSVHHIYPRWNGIDNSKKNLITLCVSCHQKIEHETTKLIDQGIDPISIFYEAWSR